MPNTRLQLRDDVHMTLDGQPQIVLSGSVFDTVLPHGFASAHVTVLAETPAPVSRPTSVRQVRTR